MASIRRASLSHAEELHRFGHGSARLAQVGSLEIGRADLDPGWRWATDVKPAVGTASCQAHHLHLLLEGRFAVRMDDGEEAEFEAGDVFEIPPGHDAWVVGQDRVVIIDISGNVADFALPVSRERVLATLLMTDIVGSTETAERIGDALWRQRLAAHNRVVRTQLERYRGREVNTTGDGFLATFGSPVAALRCAAALAAACAEIGTPIRVGVHTGEVELTGDDVAGIAVHATARITARAGPSEVLVSAVTRGLTDGSGLRFEPAGEHRLKGLETPMELFRLV